MRHCISCVHIVHTLIVMLMQEQLHHIHQHWCIWHKDKFLPRTCHLYNKRRYVCLSVCIYVPYGRPNGWADRDQTWHTQSCPPRECFCQGQCQGHSCMRAGMTELRNARNAVRKRHLANAAQTTSGGRGRRHLANAYETPSGRSSNEARRRRRRAASAKGTSRTPSGWRVITASKLISFY